MRVRMPGIPWVRGAAGGTERRRGSLRCDVGEVRPDGRAPAQAASKADAAPVTDPWPPGGWTRGRSPPATLYRQTSAKPSGVSGREGVRDGLQHRPQLDRIVAAHHLPAAVLRVEKPIVGVAEEQRPRPQPPSGRAGPQPSTLNRTNTATPSGTDHPASASEPHYEGAAPQHAPARATYAPRSFPPRTDSGRRGRLIMVDVWVGDNGFVPRSR